VYIIIISMYMCINICVFSIGWNYTNPKVVGLKNVDKSNFSSFLRCGYRWEMRDSGVITPTRFSRDRNWSRM